VNGATVTGIMEKPGEGNEPSDLVNIVTHVHNDPAALLNALQNVDESKDDGYEQALDTLFNSKEYVAAPYDGAWHPVKYPWHLLPLLEHFLSGIDEPQIDESAEIHETAIIDGNVVIEEGVKVLPHATVKGPCYIGAGRVVANNALVRNASVGMSCVVGYNTEIKGSVLHSDVWTHIAYVGDSIIGSNVSFGGGSMTGNFRLDEGEIFSAVGEEKIATSLTKFGSVIGNDCRLGIHVSLNPGIKIGAGTFITSDARIGKDVPEQSYVSMKAGEMVIVENKQQAPQKEDREGYRPGN
jgi:bifunctional UDP-N-acetylglucosamine pyrophosphorylase/glucosamine-1-phosphate N-acetyltransferase